jgi:DNA polymerase I
MSDSRKKLLLIDTFNFLHRAYHALPKTFTDEHGSPTNAVYGVTAMLINVFNQLQPNYTIAAMDSQKPTFRVEDFTGYKAHRKPMEDDLAVQIPKVLEILSAFGIKQITVDGYEADDIIGTITKEVDEDVEMIIVSNDRDLWQLVNEDVTIMMPGKGNIVEWVGPDEVRARMDMEPMQIIDYKALRGDPSDNIPGVRGVGDKTATKLIKEYANIEEVYKNIANITPESLKTKLANSAEEAVMSKHLATIVTDVPFDLDLKECKYTEFNRAAVRDVLQRYNFKSLIKRLGFEVSKDSQVDPSAQLPLL